MGPRAQSANLPSSPLRTNSHPAVNRRLDFVQDESSLQETPASSGSGQLRGKRPDVYDIQRSPSQGISQTLEESIQEEIMAAGDLSMFDGIPDESYVSNVGNDADAGATNGISENIEEESEVVPDPPKEPKKRGRKRKSEAMAPPPQEEALKSRRRGAPTRQSLENQRKDKIAAAAPITQPRRSKRVSEITEDDSVAEVNEPLAAPTTSDSPPTQPKRRGRPPKNTPQAEKTEPEKVQKPIAVKEKQKPKRAEEEREPDIEEPVFKKPKSAGRPPKKPVEKPTEKPVEKERVQKDSDQTVEAGKLVDVHGKPISKADIDQMSATSTGSRFGRGRHLSVFRELEPQTIAHVGRTGRHRVKPIEFWRNEKCAYDSEGNMQAIVKNEMKEPARPAHSSYKSKAKKKGLTAIEEDEEVELEAWEEENGVFSGIYKGWDAEARVPTNEFVEGGMFSHLSLCSHFYIILICCRYGMGFQRHQPRRCSGRNFQVH